MSLKKTSFAVYGVGGCGLRQVHALGDNLLDGVRIHYMDSAPDVAAVLPRVTSENSYIIPDGRGSAKDRGTNSATFQTAMPEILRRLKPADINVVVASAGGGTGGVAMHHLVGSLMKRENTAVFVFLTLSETSEAEVQNCTAALRSLQKLCLINKSSIVVKFLKNGPGEAYKQAMDAEIKDSLVSLFTLCQHSTLDWRDVKNLSDPSITPALKAPFGVYTWDTAAGRIASNFPVLSVATVAAETLETFDLGCMPKYSCQGTFNSEDHTLVDSENEPDRLFLYVKGNEYPAVFDELSRQCEALKSASPDLITINVGTIDEGDSGIEF